MCEINKDIKFQLFFKQTPKIDFPEHNRIETHFLDCIRALQFFQPFPRMYETLKYLYLISLLGNTSKKIWFSTYFSFPPPNWKGYHVVFVHDLIYERYPNLMPGSKIIIDEKKKAIQAANLIFCNSNTTAKDLQAHYQVKDERIIVTYLSHDNLFTVKTDEDINHRIPFRYILYVGSRQYYKNFITLFDAYVQWDKKDIIKLLVVGPEFSYEEKSIIKREGCQNYIK